MAETRDTVPKGLKETMGDVTKIYFPDYNVAIKGAKGTVIIKEISLGQIKIQ